jgi:hypothetical protein
MVTGAMEHRDERIIIETERHRINGVLRLPRDGYRSRLTDYLNASERGFIPLTDVEIEGLERRDHLTRRHFVAVSISHIVVVFPADPEPTDPRP